MLLEMCSLFVGLVAHITIMMLFYSLMTSLMSVPFNSGLKLLIAFVTDERFFFMMSAVVSECLLSSKCFPANITRKRSVFMDLLVSAKKVV